MCDPAKTWAESGAWVKIVDGARPTSLQHFEGGVFFDLGKALSTWVL